MNIEIDGKEYVLNVDMAIANKLLIPIVRYDVGTIYERGTGDFYILSRCEVNVVCLISLRDGNRWTSPGTVSDSKNITEKEWKQIGGYNYDDFKPVKLSFTVAARYN